MKRIGAALALLIAAATLGASTAGFAVTGLPGSCLSAACRSGFASGVGLSVRATALRRSWP